MSKEKNKIKFLPLDTNLSGLSIKTLKAGIKSHSKEDIGIVIFDQLANISYVLTKSQTSAANIQWLKSIKNHGKVKVLFANSGNANAFTGKMGVQNVKKIVSFLSKKYNCKDKEVIVSSTGVIGEQLPINRILQKLQDKEKKLKEDQQNWKGLAKSIMTTDTFPKSYIRNIIINKKKVKILGIAKGSGMIAPDMATMLAFIFIDIKVPRYLLNKIIKDIVDKSFNSITIDSDMSTNDMFCLISTNRLDCGSLKSINNPLINKLKEEIQKVAIELAKMIVIDGEGAKKLIEINISGALKKKDAKAVAMSIANSPLVKTAIAGEDANWGRIIMAIGKSKAKIFQKKIGLKIGKYKIVSKGELIKDYNEKKVNDYLKGKKINIEINLGIGKYESKVWTCDLTKKYIEINADYRS